MKKLLFVVPLAALLMSCGKVEEQLPSVSPDLSSVKMNYENCGMSRGAGDTTEPIAVSLDIEGSESKYVFEIGPHCYAHNTYDEFLLNSEGYIKSKSTYKVDRLVIDFVYKNGNVNFEVLDASENAVTSHESSVETEFPGDNDYGHVFEYPINGESWTIRNVANKAALYSITVYFEL